VLNRQIGFYKHFVPLELRQKIGIDPRIAIGNRDRSNCLLIKLGGSRASDDSINITQFVQPPERRKQERFPDTASLHQLGHTFRPKESSARALVRSESDDLLVY